jgi:peptide/nickel transport system substrate-binding protein
MSGTPPTRRRGFVSTLLVSMTLLASCTSGGDISGGDGDGSDASAGAADAIVVVGAAQPATFAFDAGGGGSYEILEFTANNGATLIRYPYIEGASGVTEQDPAHYEGLLAESYDVSDDGLTYTFHLRQDVVSQQGNPLTAEDVRWTFERKFASPGSSTAAIMAPSLTDPASQIKAIDETTVAFTIPEAGYGYTFLGNLTVVIAQIYDSTYLKEQATPDDPYAVEWTRANANFGFGAYELIKFTPGEEMILEANPDYVLGEPEVKTIYYRVSGDPGTRANLLRNGDVDIAEELLPADQVQLSEQGISSPPDVRTNNLNTVQLVSNKTPFEDAAVRRAFTYAVPYQQITHNVYRGRATRQTGLLPLTQPGYDDTGLEEYTYNPDLARQMLADAGHPDGVTFTLTVSNAVPDLQETAVQIQSFAASAGFFVEIREVPPAEILTGRREGTFEAYLLRQQLINLAPFYVLDIWFKDSPTSNVSQWFSPEFRAIIEKGALVSDQLGPEANALWNEAQRMLVEQAPVVPVAAVQPLSGFGERVGGYAWRTDNVLDFSIVTLN